MEIDINYKIVLNAYDKNDLNKKSRIIKDNASDLLLSGPCLLQLLITNQDDMDDVEEKDDFNEGKLIQRPLAISYIGTGNSDIRDKIKLQNPITKSGVYCLDLSLDNKTFDLIEHDYLDWFSASDKVVPYFYTFIGNPEEVFKEFVKKDYNFKKIIDKFEKNGQRI